jgi:hypothetical protein
MQRSDDDTCSVAAPATFVAESKSRVSEVRGRQHSTCPMQ